MWREFEVGGQFPRPEDGDRLRRYEQARLLFDGKHWEHDKAKRIADKLRESNASYGGLSAEGVVYLVVNMPRLIVSKFADLQVLQKPVVMAGDEDQDYTFEDRVNDDIPDLWGRIHYAMQLKRALGDVVMTVSKDADGGPIDMRVVDPSRWFPVLDPNDPLKVTAHQIAWTEEHDSGRETDLFLRVDVCYPDRVEHRAYQLEGERDKATGGHKIKRQADLAEHWEGLAEVDDADMGGLLPCIHLANGSMDPATIFGRPEFLDSGTLIDDINWRLATWSDANDKVAHAPRIVPRAYITQDEDGNVELPSQYTRVYLGGSSADPNEYPRYMTYELDHQSIKDQFEASMLALLMRHEMSPALLGLQFGRERESGEAKSLGMGTTEAATRRDLLQTQPRIDQALTALARLAGDSSAEVSTYWRVGLPKTQAELLSELKEKKNLGVITLRDCIRQLYPHMDADAVDAKLEELREERETEAQADMAPFTPQMR